MTVPNLTSVELGWFNGRIHYDAVEADTINVYVRHPGEAWGSPWSTSNANTPDVGVLVNGLSQLTAYEFALTGVLSGVESDKSNVLPGTTKKKPNTD